MLLVENLHLSKTAATATTAGGGTMPVLLLEYLR
jgi:hypothetical protein